MNLTAIQIGCMSRMSGLSIVGHYGLLLTHYRAWAGFVEGARRRRTRAECGSPRRRGHAAAAPLVTTVISHRRDRGFRVVAQRN